MKEKIKGALAQTSTRAYQKIDEEFTFDNFVLENSQNAFEHGDATVCQFNFKDNKEGRPSIIIFNNGKPMSDEQFNRFISEYHCHDITNSTPSSNGVFTSMKGYGLKDSLVFASAKYGHSKITVRNYHPNGKLTFWVWDLCKENGDAGSYDKCITETYYNVSEHPSGFEIEIENSRLFTKTDIDSACNSVVKKFTTEYISKGKSIQLVWKGEITNIPFYDPMHFEQMPILNSETIYTCKSGEYFSDDVIWFVRDAKFKGANENGEIREVPIRVIFAYFNRPTYVKKFPQKKYRDSIEVTNAGVYPLLGQTYLETGNNARGHFNYSDNGGGCPRFRICPIITQENAFLWGINSAKNNGIINFNRNPLLCESFRKLKDDGTLGESLFEYLENILKYLSKFHDTVIRTKKGDFDYYKVNGFIDRQKIKNDINEFETKKSKSTSEKVICEYKYIVPTKPEDTLYLINEKNAILKRVMTEDGIVNRLNTEVLNSDFNDATPVDMIYSIFDTLAELRVDPCCYKELARILPKKIRHYD